MTPTLDEMVKAITMKHQKRVMLVTCKDDKFHIATPAYGELISSKGDVDTKFTGSTYEDAVKRLYESLEGIAV